MVEDERAVADAHPLGARPFGREEYINKFKKLAAGKVSEEEQERFLKAVQDLENLTDLRELNVCLTDEALSAAPETPKGLF